MCACQHHFVNDWLLFGPMAHAQVQFSLGLALGGHIAASARLKVIVFTQVWLKYDVCFTEYITILSISINLYLTR